MSHSTDRDGSAEGDAQLRLATGSAGLDRVLEGGFPVNRLYLLEGDPGTGKTTLALQFLLEGARRKEPVLYVTLSETKEELTAVARSHGWSLEGVNLHELVPPEESLKAEAQYTIFHPSEVELGETTRAVVEEVERIQPRRVVFDSLSEMRLFAAAALELLQQAEVDVLVSDIGMPAEDGYALIGQARSLTAGRARRPPAIALTAYASEEDRRRALAAGFDAHVSKPVEPAELVSVIARLVASPRREARI